MLKGLPIARKEDFRLLTGQGQYVDDLQIGGMLHMAVLRSSWPHARITAIDTEQAQALDGVAGVFTHTDFGSPLVPIPLRIGGMPGLESFLQYPIAVDKVRFVGEPIAVVVAESRQVAEDALELINVDVEDLPLVLDWESAVAAPSLLHEEAGTNISTLNVGRGDADAAFSEAPYTRRETFTMHRHTAVPMETRGLLADWNTETQQLTLWGGTKVPFMTRSIISSMMKLPPESVVVKYTDIGGGFGVRGEFYPEDFFVPFLSRHLGRPVKWIEDRQEHFLSTNHSRESSCDLEIACNLDGTIDRKSVV